MRVMSHHEANCVMERASLDIATMMFRCQLLQQRIKGVKIITDAVNSVRVRHKSCCIQCVHLCALI